MKRAPIAETKAELRVRLALAAGYLPPSDVLVRETIHTMTHQVWINRQYICSTDRDYLADMVSRAINHWRKTPDGMKWWSERQKADNGGSEARHE